jgi:hypothetical protein
MNYHIYLKGECILPNLSEEKFKQNWECLQGLVGFMKTDYTAEDLSYEEVEPLVENPTYGEGSSY